MHFNNYIGKLYYHHGSGTQECYHGPREQQEKILSSEKEIILILEKKKQEQPFTLIQQDV